MLATLKRYTLFYFLFFSLHTLGQNTSHICGTDEILSQQLKTKNQRNLLNEVENKIIDFTNNKSLLRTTSNGTYTIPVVVHVIHNGGAENISDAQILKGIKDLNDAFNNTGYYDTIIGTTIGIEFCLAKQDENGQFTTGITHTQSALTDMLSPSQDAALKNLIRWNTSKYLNIWLVKEITSESAGAGVAGYAYFPSAHGSSIDGVVNEARYFGSTYDNSKVHIHEVGHYLGLYHTFEGGCPNGNCLTQGDRVCDTPPDQSTAVVPCANLTNTCSTDANDNSSNNPFRSIASGGIGDQYDMTSNYMDYGNQYCQVLFTSGQRDRMIAALTTTRSSLLDSKGCEDLCPNPIQLAFTPSDTTVTIGSTVHFNNQTVGATTYAWKVNESLESNLSVFSYNFIQQGKQYVRLQVSNGDPACTSENTIEIVVRCATRASFTGPAQVKPNQTVTLTNTTPGMNTYQWFLNGSLISTNQNLQHTFSSSGGYMVYLVSNDQNCYDTSQTMYIQVSDCAIGNEGNLWYFGMWTGVDFSASEPNGFSFTPTTSTLYHFASEACISMSDANGSFLFFATPEFAFTKERILMPNGSGLLGDGSSTQMASIINPGNPNRYYLFTLDAFGGTDGFRYSEIDMTLNGGLGDVVANSKNTLLLPLVTEKITTVRHANGIDTWVIVHQYETDAFYCYPVSPSGIGTPIISHVGSVHVKDTYNQNVLGQLKASPDGCRLALAVAGANYIELFNFSAATGIVSNPLKLNDAIYRYCYGVEFSPDGSKLYVGSASTHNIYQLNVENTDLAQIQSSSVLIGNADCLGELGAFQIGPQGKIYIARNGELFLGVINSPNSSGLACNLVNEQISLGSYACQAGLPTYDQSLYYSPKPKITGPDTVCAYGQNVVYRISNSTCSNNISTWSYTGKGTLVTSDQSSATIDFGEKGIDTLIIQRTAACGITQDTLLVVVKALELDIKDTIQCSATHILLNAGSSYSSYLWQDNSTLQTYSASGPGRYWVTVTSPDGCSLSDTIRVLPYTPQTLWLGADTMLCAGNIHVLNASNNFSTFDWQDYSKEQTFTVFQPGKYWVKATDFCKNTFTDTIEFLNCCKINIPNLITPNNDGLNDTFEVLCLDSESGWTLEISNSWGEIIYKNSNYKNNWGAKNISDGVYFYLLKKDSKKYKGWVQVIR